MKSVWNFDAPRAHQWRRVHQIAYDDWLPLPAPVRAILKCYSMALYWRNRLDWFVMSRGRRESRNKPIIVSPQYRGR